MSKIRRIDFYPDEFLSAVAGMTIEEIGMYWFTCCLIASTGGPVDIDDTRFHAIKGRKPHLKLLRERLVDASKLQRTCSELDSKLIRGELEAAMKRISSAHENGAKGGRPSKNNNDLEKPPGFDQENRLANHTIPNQTTQSETNRYAFEGKLIKLNHADYDAWRKLYHAIPDLRAELGSLDIWAADKQFKGNWFPAVSKMLSGKHQEYLIKNPPKPKRPQTREATAAIGLGREPTIPEGF